MGWPYIIFNVFLCTSAVLTWQTAIMRVLAAKDSKTCMNVYTRTSFFFVCRFLIPGIWGIAALATLGSGLSGNDTLFAMPKFLGGFVPIGLMGLLIAAMLAADMSTDSSYMLTWGSVIYNDILRPFRKGEWSAKKGLLVNRFIIASIGVFLLFFGLLYQPPGDLWTYLGITGTIYLASMSTLLIACCYWTPANDWGAAGAIVVGAAIPVASLVIELLWQKSVTAKEWTDMAIDVQRWKYYSNIAAYVLAAVAMVVGSLVKPNRVTTATTQAFGGQS
jgi:SSS family solute:Na+ symporter